MGRASGKPFSAFWGEIMKIKFKKVEKDEYIIHVIKLK
jgi:hypothetical protein